MLPDRLVSPPIPDEAFRDAAGAAGDALLAAKAEAARTTHRRPELDAALAIRLARASVQAAAPALYKAWGEELVERIRTQGAKDANPDEGFGGDLHECIADAAGNWSGEFWRPQDIANGCADYVADLLSPDGEDGQ